MANVFITYICESTKDWEIWGKLVPILCVNIMLGCLVTYIVYISVILLFLHNLGVWGLKLLNKLFQVMKLHNI